MTNKPIYHLVSFSGGKDSTAMLLKMVEQGMEIDEIIFCNTGLDFPEMYEHIKKVEEYIGRKITIVKAEQNFETLFLEHIIKHRKGKDKSELTGYSWPSARIRWCTARLKDMPRIQYLKSLRKKYNIVEYIGLAYDERARLERDNNKKENHRHPLVDWQMTEKDCLNYCLERGFTWGGLYNYFDRVSCWCCPLQAIGDLRILYHNFPNLWSKLREWDSKTWRKFRPDYSINELETRFDLEDEYIKEDKPIRDKAFFIALKNKLKESTNNE